MASKHRNYKAEYARRIERALAKGLSRSQARGHAKANEAPRRTTQAIDDVRIQLALRVLTKDHSLATAARAAKVSPERLRRHAVEQGLILKEGRKWQVNPQLPRQMMIFSVGRSRAIVVGDKATASLVGQFMSAVGWFLETNNSTVLNPYVGQSVRDIKGKQHPFETRPNVLYRLSAAGENSFEQIYRVVV